MFLTILIHDMNVYCLCTSIHYGISYNDDDGSISEQVKSNVNIKEVYALQKLLNDIELLC